MVDLIAYWPSLQHRLLKAIFEGALGKSITDDAGVMMEDGSKILINDIIQYPLFTEAKKKVCFLLKLLFEVTGKVSSHKNEADG